MTLSTWASIYPWTVIVAVFVFADTTGGLAARAWSVVKLILWPVTLAFLIAWHLPNTLRVLWWSMNQPQFIRRTKGVMDAAVANLKPMDAYNEAEMRLRGVRACLRRFHIYPVEGFLLCNGSWHKWLLQEEQRLVEIKRRELFRQGSGEEGAA